MSFAPILTAPLIVQLHVIAALCAIVLGPFAFLRRTRDFWHKSFGYAWVFAMGMTALTSLGIRAELVPGAVSPIHALSLFTLWGLWKGINAARQHRVAAHQKEMQGLYFWAIGIAGLFTFLPNRRMNAVVFGEASMLGFLVVGALIGVGLTWFVYASRKVAVPK